MSFRYYTGINFLSLLTFMHFSSFGS